MPKEKITLELDSKLIENMKTFCDGAGISLNDHCNLILKLDDITQNVEDSLLKSKALNILVDKPIYKYQIDEDVEDSYNIGKMVIYWKTIPYIKDVLNERKEKIHR